MSEKRKTVWERAQLNSVYDVTFKTLLHARQKVSLWSRHLADLVGARRQFGQMKDEVMQFRENLSRAQEIPVDFNPTPLVIQGGNLAREAMQQAEQIRDLVVELQALQCELQSIGVRATEIVRPIETWLDAKTAPGDRPAPPEPPASC